MEKIELNIGRILGSRMALHDIGIKAHKAIDVVLSELKNPALFIINLREVDPIDYEFVNIAFVDIFKRYLASSDLFIVFKCGDWEAEELFTGLVKIMNLKKEDEVSDKDFIVKNNISLIVVNDKEETKYITSLSNIHMSILKEVEAGTGIASGEIQKKFTLNAEDTSKILSELLNCKFIYQTNGPIYHSIKNLI